jgi:hypothetical protein
MPRRGVASPVLLSYLFLGVALTIPAAGQQAEKRVALVIGNGAYADSPLKNPVNDARAMTAALNALGFDVIARENVTQKQMQRAIAEFGRKVAGGGVGLFYYAGHGMQVGGKNYLLPVDAVIESEADVRLETVDVDAVLDQVRDNRLNLVILDACRNNPFERRFRGGGRGLAIVEAPVGTMIAYATAPGKVARDGDRPSVRRDSRWRTSSSGCGRRWHARRATSRCRGRRPRSRAISISWHRTWYGSALLQECPQPPRKGWSRSPRFSLGTGSWLSRADSEGSRSGSTSSDSVRRKPTEGW